MDKSPYRPIYPRTDFQLNDLSVVESCQYIFVYKSKSFNLAVNVLWFLKWANP